MGQPLVGDLTLGMQFYAARPSEGHSCEQQYSQQLGKGVSTLKRSEQSTMVPTVMPNALAVA